MSGKTSGVMEKVLKAQKDEITGYETYMRLSQKIKDQKNKKVLASIAKDELKHYRALEKFSGKKLSANSLKVFFYSTLARLFGLTFGIKLMERGEEEGQTSYKALEKRVPGVGKIIRDEEKHEKILIGMLNEERLQYVGSMVLGLNDALVELTGTLAGLSFAFQNTRLIALTGLIMGIAASLSMAASEYLSTKTEGGANALKSSLYTGSAYIFTVVVLVAPYFLLDNYLVCLFTMLAVAVLVILVFNFYVAVAKDYDFKKRFLEMTGISLGVSLFSFFVGVAARSVFGIDV